MKNFILLFIYLIQAPFAGAFDSKTQALRTNTCPGYRYVYMVNVPAEKSEDEKVEFHACRQIVEPSSRPIQCERIGSIKVDKIKETSQMATEKLWEYKGGILAGAGCAVFAYSAAFASYKLGGAFAAYNYPIEMIEKEGLREEVRNDKRELGALPSIESKYTRAVPAICSKITSLVNDEHGSFDKGVMTAVRSLAAIFHQTHAMQADARAVWTTIDKKERDAKFAIYKKNVNRTNAARVEAFSTSTQAIKFVYEYLTSETMLNIPVGTSAEIAMVSPKSCIPSPEIEKMRETLTVFTELLKTGKNVLDTDIDINELIKHKFPMD
ncbi:MAG: hypothetical protein M9962_00255 [Oligoflexia bacterium]|nr:hypothetical protein [Oligoflexia bacterium]